MATEGSCIQGATQPTPTRNVGSETPLIGETPQGLKELCVFPHLYRKAAVQFLDDYNKGVLLKRKTLSRERCHGLQKLSDFFSSYGTSYQKAIGYYRQLTSNATPQQPSLLEFVLLGQRSFKNKQILEHVHTEPERPPMRMAVTFKSRIRRWDPDAME